MDSCTGPGILPAKGSMGMETPFLKGNEISKVRRNFEYCASLPEKMLR